MLYQIIIMQRQTFIVDLIFAIYHLTALFFIRQMLNVVSFLSHFGKKFMVTLLLLFICWLTLIEIILI